MLYNKETNPALSEDLEGWDGEEGGPKERIYIYIYLQLIHITVKQKPAQHCKEVILQFKINKIFFKNHFKKCLSELDLNYPDLSFCGPFVVATLSRKQTHSEGQCR